ncbi:MAG: sensor histidine kinase, partial [Brachybacterium tyrofermentans]
AKHSGASRVGVRVVQTSTSLHVRIEDDGRGGATVRRDGFSTGLAGLTDRVRATGGRLEVTSPAEGGTVLDARLPLHSSAVSDLREARISRTTDIASTASPPSTASPAGPETQEALR